MIHVQAQQEPNTFDVNVRIPGNNHLSVNGYSLSQPLPPKTKVPPHWRNCLGDLHQKYNGICAYLCVFIERVTGGLSVDHYIAKSRLAGQIYEWSNYRLTCSTMNSRKNNFSNVLDPFLIQDGWFHIEFVSGRIYPNPSLTSTQIQAVSDTIRRLKLDSQGVRELRVAHFDDYRNGDITQAYLKRKSPFVYMEAQRQGLL